MKIFAALLLTRVLGETTAQTICCCGRSDICWPDSSSSHFQPGLHVTGFSWWLWPAGNNLWTFTCVDLQCLYLQSPKLCTLTDSIFIYWISHLCLLASCAFCVYSLLSICTWLWIKYISWSRTIRNMKQISWGVAELAHLYSLCWYNVFQLAVCYLHWFPTFMRLIHDFAGMWLTLQYDTQKDVTSCIHWHVLE